MLFLHKTSSLQNKKMKYKEMKETEKEEGMSFMIQEKKKEEEWVAEKEISAKRISERRMKIMMLNKRKETASSSSLC